MRGFMESLFQLMKVHLPILDHTTLSRRSKKLKPILGRYQSPKKPPYLIVDSTGLSIHGEGPWASGKKRRRGWRKLHLMVDREEVIQSSCVSKWYTKDGSRVRHLLDGIENPTSSFTGDKGYDQNSVYRAVKRKSRESEIIIHPRSNAVISEKGKWNNRDRHIQKTLYEGIYTWRRNSGYYQQNNVGNTIYRCSKLSR